MHCGWLLAKVPRESTIFCWPEPADYAWAGEPLDSPTAGQRRRLGAVLAHITSCHTTRHHTTRHIAPHITAGREGVLVPVSIFALFSAALISAWHGAARQHSSTSRHSTAQHGTARAQRSAPQRTRAWIA